MASLIGILVTRREFCCSGRTAGGQGSLELNQGQSVFQIGVPCPRLRGHVELGIRMATSEDLRGHGTPS